MLCSVAQTIAVCVSLWWLARQTRSASESVKEAVRAIRVSVHNATADAVNDINELVIGNDELLQANKESKQEVLRHIFFNRFEQIYTLHFEKLMDAQSWESSERWISHKMTDPEMRATWSSVKLHYRKDFANWIDDLSSSTKSGSIT